MHEQSLNSSAESSRFSSIANNFLLRRLSLFTHNNNNNNESQQNNFIEEEQSEEDTSLDILSNSKILAGQYCQNNLNKAIDLECDLDLTNNASSRSLLDDSNNILNKNIDAISDEEILTDNLVKTNTLEKKPLSLNISKTLDLENLDDHPQSTPILEKNFTIIVSPVQKFTSYREVNLKPQKTSTLKRLKSKKPYDNNKNDDTEYFKQTVENKYGFGYHTKNVRELKDIFENNNSNDDKKNLIRINQHHQLKSLTPKILVTEFKYPEVNPSKMNVHNSYTFSHENKILPLIRSSSISNIEMTLASNLKKSKKLYHSAEELANKISLQSHKILNDFQKSNGKKMKFSKTYNYRKLSPMKSPKRMKKIYSGKKNISMSPIKPVSELRKLFSPTWCNK